MVGDKDEDPTDCQLRQMNVKIIVILLLGAWIGIGGAGAQPSEVDVNALLQRLQELEQRVKLLERNAELNQEAATDQAQAAPTVSVGADGLEVRSADTNFVFALHGLLQVDSRTFFDDGGIAGNDGFLLRRARPIFSGTIYRDFDFNFSPDFGGPTVQIFDAYLHYRYQPWLQARIGKFKTPIGLEYLQPDPVTAFNERALPSGLVSGRDVGFQLGGEVNGGTLSYAVGIFNGLGDGRNSGNMDFDDSKEFAGRLFTLPFLQGEVAGLRGLGLGVGGSWTDYSPASATGLPEGHGYNTVGQQQFFAYNTTTVADGAHWRVAPQGYYYFGPFSLLGEYTLSALKVRQTVAPFQSALLRHTGWQVTVGWVLTGEAATFNGVTPRRAFDPRHGNWGAFQIVGRYGELNLDEAAFPIYADPAAAARSAQVWTVGLNWYPNKNLTVKTSYARTTFDGGGTGATPLAAITRQPEQVFFTRAQLSF